MKKLLVLGTFIFIGIVGCSSNNTLSNKDGMQGSDRDVHGCIGSAGYQWCGNTNQCERPWELAEKKGFKNSQEQFDLYCSE